MRINKTAQTGMLLTLYLARSGRATLEDVSANLGISMTFLQQVARKLRLKGVINSRRGPGGGYELNHGAHMSDVLDATDSLRLMEPAEMLENALGQPEQRALAHYMQTVVTHLNTLLNRKVENVMKELIANEMVKMDRLESGLTN